jgi:hypothetical protein
MHFRALFLFLRTLTCFQYNAIRQELSAYQTRIGAIEEEFQEHKFVLFFSPFITFLP